ncbi:MAG: alpha-amylase family glycosyl hydrolase [Bacteroidota bacterium]
MKKNIRLAAILLMLLTFGFQYAFAQTKIKKTVFQGFWWDYWNSNYKNGWSNYLTELAPRLKSMGFDAIWIPPSYKNSSTGSVGYSPFDQYDLGDKYQKGGGDSLNVRTRMGTKDELLRMIAVMHANGIEVISDVVLNHLDGAGANSGAGGQDPEPNFSMINAGGYKNFRYSSYATPLLDESQDDYWTRSGRWAKNYPNFYPNLNNNCTTGDICSPFFGPDISYESSAYGQSSNIPASGTATIGGVTRPYYNPVQSSNHMRDNSRNWLMWYKKQTGTDGWRWDAVKHFPVNVQEDLIYNTKYSLPAFAQGGQDMFCIGEWIGTASELDAYVNNVKTGVAPGGVTNEKHTGTFDFSYRGYGPNGGIYSMVTALGGYNMQNLPGEQQGERYMDYPGSKRVHRSLPFVNSHDTYRPIVDVNGNFSKPLGDASGWNTGGELGGNGQHLDPREPRLAAAYAAIIAVDGNPVFFFEDLFDIGTTSKRYSHLPGSSTDLPVRSDLQNILRAHQKLGFKDGDYGVPTSSGFPFYQAGSSGDHLVIERKGKAIIGVTDAFNATSTNSNDQEVYVTVDGSLIGQNLYDYSGAHGVTPSLVFNDSRVLIRTAPVGHTIPGANGHGYSIWAPYPGTPSSVNDLYNHLATYSPSRAAETILEWELADDLGDKHCKSLGYGGRLPDNSTKQRVAGKFFTDAGKPVLLKIFPEIDGRNLTAGIYDLEGNALAVNAGISTAASPLTINYNTTAAGWLVVKIRNTGNAQAGQKVFANLAYTAPQAVNTLDVANNPQTKVATWTGNALNTDPGDCGNWEEGRMPDVNTKMIIQANAAPHFPIVSGNINAKDVVVEDGASISFAPAATLTVYGNWKNLNSSSNNICGKVIFAGALQQTIEGNNVFCKLQMNSAAGVLLKSHTTVSEELQLSNGVIVIDDYDLTLSPVAIITGGSAASYVQTKNLPGTGGFLKAMVSNSPVLFPVGNTNYTPATLTNIGTPMQFSIRNFEDALENGTSGASITASGRIEKSWEMIPAGIGANIHVTFQWNGISEVGLIRSTCFISKNKNGAGEKWVSLNTPGPAGGNDPYTRSASAITDFSTFTVFSNPLILPVNILSVSGVATGHKATINWKVSGQENISGYQLEKSGDGNQFNIIAFVPAINTPGIIDYISDDNHFSQAAYYRVISIGTDGSRKFSSTIFLKNGKGRDIRFVLAPNPVKTSFVILSNAGNNEVIQAKLVSADGRIISLGKGKLDDINAVLNGAIQGQPAGVYTVWLVTEANSQAIRLIKQ